MKVRTKFEDIASMALIYVNRATGCNMISYDKVIEFDRMINHNLDEMNSKINPSLFYEEESKLYFHSTDENGKVYLVIDPSADLKKAESYHIGCLPIDIVVASQMKNALDIIGLKLEDGKLRKKSYGNTLTLAQILDKIVDDKTDFYLKVADELSAEEMVCLASLVKDKSCDNCSNTSCCDDFLSDKKSDSCVAWYNKEMIGKTRVLVNDKYKR